MANKKIPYDNRSEQSSQEYRTENLIDALTQDRMQSDIQAASRMQENAVFGQMQNQQSARSRRICVQALTYHIRR